MLRRLSLTVLVLLSIASGAIQACSCVVVSTACGVGLNRDSTVFLGTVISKIAIEASATGGSPAHIPTGYSVRFTITENFQGAGSPGQEIAIYTGEGGSDCGYPFVVGASYLVRASTFNGQLATSLCSGTNPEVMVGSLLNELRAVRDGDRVDDLFGTTGILSEGARSEDLAEMRPLADIAVHVRNSKGEVFYTKTDANGAYAFARLPRDTYHVEQELPAGLSRTQSKTGESLGIEVDDKTGAGAGCQVDIFVRPDGQISGTVVDGSGKGVPGFVTIQPADPTARQVAMSRGGLPGCDTADGNFSLPQLAPGRYRLVFHPSVGNSISFQQTFYWPRLSDSPHSIAIELALGQHIDNVRFEVTATDRSE